ncbi:MAG: cytochrome c-type biogenesis protein CcmH [Hyphomonadaceae bacterium]|nr:cytochrome c-type biogenesis protein CcmH [Hyphomonadaceae bacterium]
MKALIAAALIILANPTAAELNSAEEARAQALMREIRCIACENEPISQSTSDIAGNMRERVRIMVAEGASDAEIRTWFEDRYGEFVLFRPKVQGASDWVLWGAPFLLLVGGVALGYGMLRRKASAPTEIEAVAPEDLEA